MIDAGGIAAVAAIVIVAALGLLVWGEARREDWQRLQEGEKRREAEREAFEADIERARERLAALRRRDPSRAEIAEPSEAEKRERQPPQKD